ncbi:MAG: carboxy terminal-processing peptidase [Puniceicoccales bacterium]|jgi:carboxyl-terminal processing protease|nr:carboxy terminal-processing peptidase [Puniceicoccales bacterium]
MNKKFRLFFLTAFKYIIFCTALVYYLGGRPCVQAKKTRNSATGDEKSRKIFVQTAIMRTETIFLVRFLEELHFLKKPLSEVDSHKLIEEFLLTLDPQRMFFTQADKDSFTHQYALSLELLLRGGSLTPAFNIFEGYRTIAEQRIHWIHKRLQGDFNFNKNLFYDANRKEASWAKTRIELDLLWHQRLQHELLNEALAVQLKENAWIEDGVEDLSKSAKNEPEDETLSVEQCIKNLADAKAKLADQYNNLLSCIDKIDAVDIQEIFLNTVAHFYDPHTTFFSADSMEDFSISLHNALVGIGAYLSEENGLCVIKELLPGGPAEQDKRLHPGDKILAVAQDSKDFVNIQGMKLRQSVKLIRGPRNSKVRLLIQPFDAEPSERRIIELVREEIKLTNNLASAKLFYLSDPQGCCRVVGLIDLPAFYGPETSDNNDSHCISEDVKALILQLETYDIEGLILDLRRNGGGLLNEAVKLAGLFLDRCPVVQIKDTTGKITQQFAEPHTCVWKGPLLILTSRFSASASEIVAGALQTYRRALVFGDKTTHGKGTVQAVVEMDRLSLFPCAKSILGAAKITLQKWYLPDGRSTQKKGVCADLFLPSLYDVLPVGESDLPNALEWDSILPIPAKIDNPVCEWIYPGLIQYLHQQRLERQLRQPAFDWYQHQIDYFKCKYEQNRFTLNLTDRIHQLSTDRMKRKELDMQADQLLKWKKYYKNFYLSDVQIPHRNLTRFDIYEDEAVQMMVDWLYFLGASKHLSKIPSYCSKEALWNQYMAYTLQAN